ncbi:MAG TPA: glutaredoxin family protein [Candidatus Binatia bacterium]|jgi:glutaredoxin 3
MTATLYARGGCSFCEAARRDLAARGVAFVEVDVGEHPEAIPELLKLTRGVRVLPVIVEGGRIKVAPDGGGPF